MSDEICDWPGRSGAMYRYWIYVLDRVRFDPKPGNYIYAKQTRDGEWLPVYIGESSDLAARRLERNVEVCIAMNGATHLHAHVNADGDNIRAFEARDLVENYQPACNRTGERRASSAKGSAAKRKRATLWPPDFFNV